MTRKLDLDELGFAPIELDDDELPDGAILMVRSHLSGDRVRFTMRSTGGDWMVHRGMLSKGQETLRELELANEEDEDEDEVP
jgi:hypothetical protein